MLLPFCRPLFSHVALVAWCGVVLAALLLAGMHWAELSENVSDQAAFAEAVSDYPEVLDCYVLLGNVDFLLRIVTEDIKAYERFFFEKLSQLPGIQEVNSSIVMSDIKHTTALPI